MTAAIWKAAQPLLTGSPYEGTAGHANAGSYLTDAATASASARGGEEAGPKAYSDPQAPHTSSQKRNQFPPRILSIRAAGQPRAFRSSASI